MNWVKLSDEMPTEEGLYCVATNSGVWTIVFYLENVKCWQGWGITHWLLIQPPKGEQK